MLESLVIANDPELEENTRRRAYEIWLAEGQPEGRADEHWARAEHDIRKDLAS